MATIINEIAIADSKGEVSFKFSVNQNLSVVFLETAFPKNDATDISIEIPISEWDEVVDFISSLRRPKL